MNNFMRLHPLKQQEVYDEALAKIDELEAKLAKKATKKPAKNKK